MEDPAYEKGKGTKKVFGIKSWLKYPYIELRNLFLPTGINNRKPGHKKNYNNSLPSYPEKRD